MQKFDLDMHVSRILKSPLLIPCLIGLFFLFFQVTPASAQEVYLSISGRQVIEKSGDQQHVYEYWLRPDSGAINGSLQIFDAGLGGPADLIAGKRPDTQTQFQLFPFSTQYKYENHELVKQNTGEEPIQKLTADNEVRFKNRWTALASLSADDAGKGYLLRVRAGDGNDINSFKLRVVDANGAVLTKTSWHLIAIDLSIGLFHSTPGNQFQIRPYDKTISSDILLNASGQEDSKVLKLDSFGAQNADLSNHTTFPAQKYGMENRWGIEITGSDLDLNNLTITGVEHPVLWEFEPVLLQEATKPVIGIKHTLSGSCSSYQFNLNSPDIGPGVLRKSLWLRDGETIAHGDHPSITFPSSGTLSVTALIPNKESYFPQFWIHRDSVFINRPPTAQIQTDKTIISPGESVQLSASGSSDPDQATLSYSWYINNEIRSHKKDFTFHNSVPGLYHIKLVVNDGGTTAGCSEATAEKTIRVNSQPYAEISLTSLFGTDEPVTFSVANQSDADNDTLEYHWKGSGIVEPPATGTTVTVRQPTAGDYTISLLVDDQSGTQNATYQTTASYKVNAAPVPVFTLPEQAAPGEEISLDAFGSHDTNPDTLSYTWKIDNKEITQTPRTTTSLASAGDYTVTLIVDDNKEVSNSVQQLSRSIHINAAPEPVISAVDSTTSARQSFSASRSQDADNSIAQYHWDFGDGTTGEGPNIDHIFPDAGHYNITLTVDDGQNQPNSIQKAQHSLFINEYPKAAFTLPEVVGPGQKVTLNARRSSDPDGNIMSFKWWVDGAFESQNSNDTFNFQKPGLHTVKLWVRDNSGFDDAVNFLTRQIRVNAPPVPRWSVNKQELVAGQKIHFRADSSFDPDGTIIQYSWKFDDGKILTGKDITRSFKENGNHKFTLTVTDGDGVNNSSRSIGGSVNLNHQPFIVTQKTIRTNDLSVNLDASSSYDLDDDNLSFEWTLPDGSKRHSAAFTWEAPSAGVHFIGLTVNDGKQLPNSQNEESVKVLINQPVQAVVDSLIRSCTGQTILFNSSDSFDPDGDPFSAQWNFGDGSQSGAANPSHSYDEPGVYETIVKLSDGFSQQPTVAKIPVIIEGSPFAKMNLADTTICVNSPMQFDGSQSTDPSGNLSSYRWDFGDGQTASGPQINHLYTEPGDYMVSLTVEGSGSGQCSNVSQVTGKVHVVAGPTAAFEIPEWIAPNQSLELNASKSHSQDNINSTQWIIQQKETPVDTLEGLQTRYSFDQPGTYQVTLKLTTDSRTSCSRVSLTHTIKVNEAPEMVWNLPKAVAAGSDIQLDASHSQDHDGYIKSYNWKMDGNQIGYRATEHIKPDIPGKHTITLTLTDNAESSNRTVENTKSVFINSAPEADFSLPGPFYQNQSILLQPADNRDADGDELQSTWKVNGQILNRSRFKLTESKIYQVTLIQDDGRKLENSIDSTVIDIKAQPVPPIHPDYPQIIALGQSLTTQQIHLPPHVYFTHHNQNEIDWEASQSGQDSLELGWKPDQKILSSSRFPIMVVDSLAFTEQPEHPTLKWNPANPFITLQAPDVNRNSGEGVTYTWKNGDTVLGHGNTQQVELKKGTNIFTVEANDQDVYPNKTISTKISVEVEE